MHNWHNVSDLRTMRRVHDMDDCHYSQCLHKRDSLRTWHYMPHNPCAQHGQHNMSSLRKSTHNITNYACVAYQAPAA